MSDRDIIRKLAEETAEIAALPVHKEKQAEWTRMNDLKPGRPMVWINELPRHELVLNEPELAIQCEDTLCRQVESTLRYKLYLWRHLPVDMIIDPFFPCSLAVSSTGFGINEDVDVIRQDERGGILSRDFHSQIDCEADLEKIKTPIVTYDEAATNATYEALTDLLGDVLPVKKVGVGPTWFAPWDWLIRWWDVQKAMMDLVLRPELVHAAMDRLVTAKIAELEQWRELNVLSYGEGNFRVGSGGLGYTTALPAEGFDPEHVRTQDIWGCATAQIFSEVSPEMHEEFALQYERRWLSQFGITYYGCCEPLHMKMGILKSVPNLRKISASPWANVDKMVEESNGHYVLSIKPNPAILARDVWHLDEARRDLEETLKKVQGCAVEVILKDVSTLRYEPKRLWEWAEMAMNVVTG